MAQRWYENRRWRSDFGAMTRYVFLAGVAEIRVMGDSIRQEIWLGVETDGPVDLAAFSRARGYDLIPADDLSVDELRSINVTKFERL